MREFKVFVIADNLSYNMIPFSTVADTRVDEFIHIILDTHKSLLTVTVPGENFQVLAYRSEKWLKNEDLINNLPSEDSILAIVAESQRKEYKNSVESLKAIIDLLIKTNPSIKEQFQENQPRSVVYNVQGSIIQQGDRSIAVGDHGQISGVTSGNGSNVIQETSIQNEVGGITYEIPIKDPLMLEKVAVFFINHLGERKLIGIDITLGIGTIFSIIGWIQNLFSYRIFFFGIGIILILLLILITKVIFFYKNSRCDKCGKDFAVFEYQPGKRRDVESNGVIYRREERFFECRYCGDKTTSKKIERFEKQA